MTKQSSAKKTAVAKGLVEGRKRTRRKEIASELTVNQLGDLAKETRQKVVSANSLRGCTSKWNEFSRFCSENPGTPNPEEAGAELPSLITAFIAKKCQVGGLTVRGDIWLGEAQKHGPKI